MTRRAGTIEYGRIYEQKAAALFAIRCALDPTIADFWTVGNQAGLGAFDDIVLFVQNKNGSRKTYCIQMKHLENGSVLVAQLVADSGNFSLEKYYDSYQKIRDNLGDVDILKGVSFDEINFILFTNAPLSGVDKTGCIVLENVKCNGNFYTSHGPDNIFQISNKETSKKPFDTNFLQQFSFYTKQASATALDSLIKDELDTNFEGISNNVIVAVTDYFSKWFVSREKDDNRIFKRDVQMKLLECLLQPHIVEPMYGPIRETAMLQLLNDTVMSFNVTPVLNKSSLHNVFASLNYTLQEVCDVQLNFQISWNINLREDQYESLKVCQKEEAQQITHVLEEKRYYLPHITVLDLYFSAWQCHIVPLLVDCNSCQNLVQEVLYKFEAIARQFSFVLFSSERMREFNANLRVFNHFNDIGVLNVALLDRNLKNTYVSLQGKHALSLNEFKQNVEVLSEVTPDVYIFLLNGVLQVGETYEIDNYYIPRSLQSPRLNYSVLDKSNVLQDRGSQQITDIFLLVEFSTVKYIHPYRYRNNMMDLTTYIENCTLGKSDEAKYIITSNLSITDKEITNTVANLQTLTKKAVHVVKLQRYYLQWLFSSGPIDILHNYVIESTGSVEDIHGQIGENEMIEVFRSDVNIISNTSGMGKTFMLKSLTNMYGPNKWVCFIKLSEHIPSIAQIKQALPTKYIDYITNCQVKLNDQLVQKLCIQIFLNRYSSGNIVWLLDEYDEVSPTIVLPFLKYIRQMKNSKVWITTRPTYKRDLEMHMDTISLEITHFKEHDSTQFVSKYFETYQDIYAFSKEQIQNITDRINRYSNGIDKTFIAIPLQTRMLAEILGDDVSQISQNERLTIVELYKKFVNIKLKEYNPYMNINIRRTVSKLALKLFFTQEQLEDLLDLVELEEEAITFQESYRKDSIVIGLNEKGEAVFGHRSFAEFLAAQWLANVIITKKGNFDKKWIPLVEKLFCVDMISIRAFFDRIMCQNMPLHLAVLDTDVDKLNVLLNELPRKSELDKLGRSALHLAVSYGKCYDLYTSDKEMEVYELIHDFIGGHTLKVPVVKTEHQVPTTVIEELLNHGFLNTFDNLFHHDVFDYAMKSCSLESVNCLYNTMEKENLYFGPAFDLKKFLYCVVCDNLHHILSSRKCYNLNWPLRVRHQLRKMFLGDNVRFLKMKYNKSYLTELAAYMGSKEILYELLQCGQLSVHDGLPIHKASCRGQSDTIELLFKMGADVQKRASDHMFSSSSGAYKTKPLYTVGIMENMYAKTPMHYASQKGYLECIKKLTILGARVTKNDADGYTSLYYAMLYGHTNCVVFMLNTLSEEEKSDSAVQLLINVAASEGHSTEQLIKHGLNVNNIDEEGNSPLILASKNGYPKVIEELAQSNCDLNLMKTNESLLSIRMWPIRQNAEKFPKQFDTKMSVNDPYFSMNLKLFLPRPGTDVIYGGLAAIHFAILRGRVNCAKTLIRVSADKNIEDTIGLGYSPIIWASITGHEDIVETLLTINIDPGCTQKVVEDAEIALIWASILGHCQCINILLKHNFERLNQLESTLNQGRVELILKREYGVYYNKAAELFGTVNNIPVIVAAINNRPRVIAMLTSLRYKNNEDLNVALFWASKEGNLECVQVLVEAGVDVSGKTSGEMNIPPIAWASVYGQIDVVRFFLNIKKECLTHEDINLAITLANVRNQQECLKLLLDFGGGVSSCSEFEGSITALLNICERDRMAKTRDLLLMMNCDLLLRDSENKAKVNNVGRKMFNVLNKLRDRGAYQYVTAEKKSTTFKKLQESFNVAMEDRENNLMCRVIAGEAMKDDN